MINISAFETFCDQELFKMQMLQIIHVQRNYIFRGCQLRYLIAKKNCRVLSGRKIWAGNLCLFSRLTGYLSEVIQHLWALLKTLGIRTVTLFLCYSWVSQMNCWNGSPKIVLFICQGFLYSLDLSNNEERQRMKHWTESILFPKNHKFTSWRNVFNMPTSN